MLLSPKDSELFAMAKAGELPNLPAFSSLADDALAPSLAVWGLTDDGSLQAAKAFDALRHAFVPLTSDAPIRVLTAQMPQVVLDSLGLANHVGSIPSEAVINNLQDAVTLLGQIGDDYRQSVINGIDTLVMVKVRAGAAEGTVLTSITIPTFPMASFFSANAQRHLAPAALTDAPDIAVLSENLLHESVHQNVNITILERDIFPDSFDPQTARKIEIPWRQTAKETRNRFWEIDRCLHAFAVYVGVLPYRVAIAQDAGQTPSTKDAFAASITQAEKSLRFLHHALDDVRDSFAPDGQALLSELQAKNPFQ